MTNISLDGVHQTNGDDDWLRDIAVPNRKQLDRAAEIVLRCLTRLSYITSRQFALIDDLEEQDVTDLAERLSHLELSVRECNDVAVQRVVDWMGKAAPKAIVVGPNLRCRSRHQAVTRISRHYARWWTTALELHGVGGKPTLKTVRCFTASLRQQRLWLTKRRAFSLGTSLAAERDRCRILINQLRPRLSFKEKLIVDALRKYAKPMASEPLLAAAGLSWSGSHKEILAGLDDRGVLVANRGRGFHLPEWIYFKSY